MPLPSLELNFSDRSDQDACRDLLNNGSRTFFAASLLLPRAVREPATALYAFCRLADDAVDLSEGDGLQALEAFRRRLDRIYDGQPMPMPVDRALADVVTSFAIPQELPEALLEGIEWDARGRRYEDLPTLQAYAARVAGTVGAMMAILMGARSAEAIARACDLGVAMQLTNIARDVGEDARAGRIYLPLRWLREAGIDPDRWLADPSFDEALGSVVERLLVSADRLYERADPGIAGLPPACRPAIFSASRVYAEIGRQVARNGLDSVSCRAVVPGHRKIWLMSQALALAVRPTPKAPWPALEETRFLVEAVSNAALPAHARDGFAQPSGSWQRLDDRVGWVVDLFLRLEQRELESSGGQVYARSLARNG